jgi:hypothetical protein
MEGAERSLLLCVPDVLQLTLTYLIVLVEDALQEEVGVMVELGGGVRRDLQPGHRERGAHNDMLNFN